MNPLPPNQLSDVLTFLCDCRIDAVVLQGWIKHEREQCTRWADYQIKKLFIERWWTKGMIPKLPLVAKNYFEVKNAHERIRQWERLLALKLKNSGLPPKREPKRETRSLGNSRDNSTIGSGSPSAAQM